VDLEEFIRQWILSCADHEAYLAKVGQAHLKGLKKRYRQAAIRELKPFQVQKTHTGPVSYTPQEIRIFTVGMKIATIIREKRYPLVVAGIGIGNLASWIAKELLRREDIHFELAVDYGIIGYQPQPGDPFILSLNTIFSSTILTGVTQMYNQFFQKGRNRTLGVLGGGQVDKVGNLNSTFIPPDLFLPGSGGANDIASYSDEVLVTMPQSNRRFVDRFSYVTCPGDNIRTLISDLGVFEKPQGEREFLLTEYFCFSKTDHEQACIAKIQEQCGWNIKVAPEPKAIMNPPPLFMDVLDAFDPRGLFRKGFY
jgi:acyl CoA:acetate/3-ketoacid CoA transferase beta subunit